MDRYIKLRIGDKEKRVSILCMMAYLYICRSSFLVFARQFSITTIVAGIVLIGVVLSFALYTISGVRNICFDGIILIVAAVLFFYIT